MSALLMMAKARTNHATATAFTPASLYAGGQRGTWIDPSDFSTMFQDAAGTTPVTAVGQKVMLIRDKSGNNNHFSQATSSKAPTLAQDASGYYYLSFASASGQVLSAGNGAALAPRTSSFMSWVAGNPNSSATAGVFFARSQASGTLGRYWAQPNAGSSQMNYAPSSTVATSSVTNAATTPFVFSGAVSRNTSPGTVAVRVNTSGPIATTFARDDGTDENPALRLLLGAYNNATDSGEQNYLDGRVYGFFIVFDTVSPTTILNGEKWIGLKCGVAL